MKPLLYALLLTLAACFSGCRGIVSEMQKSELRAASNSVVVRSVPLTLSSTLVLVPGADTKTFQLSGKLGVNAATGAIPAGVELYHFTLKPSWKGWPGYYVANFKRDGEVWRHVGAASGDPKIQARVTQDSSNLILEFSDIPYAVGMTSKLEHYASFDVSVSVWDSQSDRRHILQTTAVPTGR